jgi:hypothetical protein
MVLKGQFLERPTLIPLASGEVLEGVSHRGSVAPGVLVVPPVPAEGSGMDHVIAAEIAFAVSRHGHQCLRFNFRGVGASQGALSSSEDALFDDVVAAWELARDNAEGGRPLVVSIGGSDRLVARLVTRDPTAAVGWALIQPSLPAFDLGLPRVVISPELDRSFDRRAWSACLGEGELVVLQGTDRGYQRNLPQVGKVVAALARRVGGSDGTPETH